MKEVSVFFGVIFMVNHKSLAEERPDLLKEWDYEKNNELGIFPDKVTCGSGKKVWWKCSKCGNSYKTKIVHRIYGHGCSICGHKYVGNINSTPVDGQSLSDNFPNLVKEWDFEKNKELKPNMVSVSSNKKVWWICSKNHSWQAIINSRTKGRGCPYCSNVKLLVGYNDFATLKPELAKEWNYKKNGNLLPSMILGFPKKKVWWICKKNHEWEATIDSRVRQGSSCPICGFNGSSYSEQAVFYHLKIYFPDAINGYRFKDNDGVFEVDIYIPSMKIAIEYDGLYWHKDKRNIDYLKEKRLKKKNIKLYRILESDKNVIDRNYIYYNFYHNRFENLSWAIKELLFMFNCGCLFVDVKNNDIAISELFYKNEINNSLAIVNPELSKEWNYSKNGKLLPSMFKPFSNKRVWWICSKCSCEWITSIAHRSAGTGCPECAKARLRKKKG